jgi:hypothetical protein
MSPSEDSSQPASDYERRARGDAVLRISVWLLWSRDVAVAGAYTAFLIAAVNFPFTATWSRQKGGFLGLLSLACAVVAIPGALVALRHPVVAAILRAQEQRFNHPRLFGLAQVWAGIVVSGWLSAMVLLLPYPPVALTYAVFLAGLGPMYATLLFDRRR